VSRKREHLDPGNAALGWWWLDPIAALLIAGIAISEGLATWRGDGCCTAPALDQPRPDCHDDCCD